MNLTEHQIIDIIEAAGFSMDEGNAPECNMRSDEKWFGMRGFSNSAFVIFNDILHWWDLATYNEGNNKCKFSYSCVHDSNTIKLSDVTAQFLEDLVTKIKANAMKAIKEMKEYTRKIRLQAIKEL